MIALVRSERFAARCALAGGALTLLGAGITSVWALASASQPWIGNWVVIDAASGVFIGVSGLVGAASLAVSPTYLATSQQSIFGDRRPRVHYYTALLVFWAALLALPLAANVGAAWLLIEATTAASALLVAYSGKPRALEAAWKYLVLTSLGLGIALLGLVILQVAQHTAGGPVGLTYTSIRAAAPGLDHQVALVAFLLILAGLAAKIGWAPVHNWLPDAHSEAPPPVSRRCSRPRSCRACCSSPGDSRLRSPASVGAGTAAHVFILFGLVSLAVAVPFLWRPLAWKRLLAYSSLEHMGVIALGIGFGGPLALVGVVVHVAGHAIAKSLGFYAALPLLGMQPSTVSHPARGVARSDPRVAAMLGCCLGALAGLPPSPLFVSELLIALGGVETGHTWAVAVFVGLLSLGFLGLVHALIDALAGRRRGIRPGLPPGRRVVLALTTGGVVLLLALTGGALALPGSAIARALSQGLL